MNVIWPAKSALGLKCNLDGDTYTHNCFNQYKTNVKYVSRRFDFVILKSNKNVLKIKKVKIKNLIKIKNQLKRFTYEL